MRHGRRGVAGVELRKVRAHDLSMTERTMRDVAIFIPIIAGDRTWPKARRKLPQYVVQNALKRAQCWHGNVVERYNFVFAGRWPPAGLTGKLLDAIRTVAQAAHHPSHESLTTCLAAVRTSLTAISHIQALSCPAVHFSGIWRR